MLFQSLRALCIAPGGPGNICNQLGAPVRSIGVSGRFGCGFPTNSHFDNVMMVMGRIALMIVSVMVIVVLEAHRHVGCLHPRLHQSIHRLRAFQ